MMHLSEKFPHLLLCSLVSHQSLLFLSPPQHLVFSYFETSRTSHTDTPSSYLLIVKCRKWTDNSREISCFFLNSSIISFHLLYTILLIHNPPYCSRTTFRKYLVVEISDSLICDDTHVIFSSTAGNLNDTLPGPQHTLPITSLSDIISSIVLALFLRSLVSS